MSYKLADTQIGIPDLSTVALAGAVGAPWDGTTNDLPSAQTAAMLGMQVQGFDSTLGFGRFVLLAVPTSTAVTIGLLYQWDKNYRVVLVPAGGTSKNTGVSVACAINTVSSNASTVQYTWFQVQGTASVLKTAVAIAPQTPMFISATAGRVKAVASAGQGIIGARSANTATVTSTTSAVNVYLNFSALEINASGG